MLHAAVHESKQSMIRILTRPTLSETCVQLPVQHYCVKRQQACLSAQDGRPRCALLDRFDRFDRFEHPAPWCSRFQQTSAVNSTWSEDVQFTDRRAPEGRVKILEMFVDSETQLDFNTFV